MISTNYKKIYDNFINHYKNTHINPWHEISEEDLENIYNELINSMDVVDDYTFEYFINYIIKKLSGKSDAHTFCDNYEFIPLLFKIFNNNVYITWPEELKGCQLISINDIEIKKIIEEMEDITTYGTEGKRIYELEKNLFNALKLYGLPSLRSASFLKFEYLTLNNTKDSSIFHQTEKYPNPPLNEYMNKNGTYEFKENTLIYYNNSNHNRFTDKIKNSIISLKQEDISQVDKIIIDLRGNTGGSSDLSKPLLEFLEENKDKVLIVLTDYRIFSAGRHILIALMRMGATTIGNEISTPLNCYANCKWINVENHNFASSYGYFSPNSKIDKYVETKEDFKSNITEEDLIPNIFKPDIYVEQTPEDFLSGNDTVMNEALNYEPRNMLRH